MFSFFSSGWHSILYQRQVYSIALSYATLEVTSQWVQQPPGIAQRYCSIADRSPYAALCTLWRFCNHQSALLNPFTFFTQAPTPSRLVTLRLFSGYMTLFCFLFVYLFCVLNPTDKWSHKVFVFLWLISLSTMTSRAIHVVANGEISFFMAI